jgi:predicted dehydrogenase
MKTFRIATIGLAPKDASHRFPLERHPRFELVEADAPDLDAVVVASPPAAHVDDVTQALARGLHVICQPPFALDVAGAQRMADAAKAAGTVCGVAYTLRFTPQAQATRELISNAHLGPMRSIEIATQTGERRGAARYERGWWFERDLGGGVAAQNLAHSIDLAIWFAARAPVATSGFVRTANQRREDANGSFDASADDGAFALLDFGFGLAARLASDATAPVESYLCAVYGEDRVAVSSGRQADETTLYTVDDDETNELQCKPSEYEKKLGGSVALTMELYDALIAQIEGATTSLPTFDQALEVQRVLAAIGA